MHIVIVSRLESSIQIVPVRCNRTVSGVTGNSGSAGENLLSPPLRSLPFRCHPTRKRGSRSVIPETILKIDAHFGVLWCCYLTQNILKIDTRFAAFWCIVVRPSWIYTEWKSILTGLMYSDTFWSRQATNFCVIMWSNWSSPFCNIKVNVGLLCSTQHRAQPDRSKNTYVQICLIQCSQRLKWRPLMTEDVRDWRGDIEGP